MKLLPLSNLLDYILIDDIDFETIKNHKWCYSKEFAGLNFPLENWEEMKEIKI